MCIYVHLDSLCHGGCVLCTNEALFDDCKDGSGMRKTKDDDTKIMSNIPS